MKLRGGRDVEVRERSDEGESTRWQDERTVLLRNISGTHHRGTFLLNDHLELHISLRPVLTVRTLHQVTYPGMFLGECNPRCAEWRSDVDSES